MSSKAVFLASLILPFLACACSKAPTSQPAAAPTRAGSERVEGPEVDGPEIVEFRQKTLAFIQEARSLATFLETGPPSLDDYQKKMNQVTDLFTEIPNPPGGRSSLAGAYAKAREAWTSLRLMREPLGTALQFQLMNDQPGHADAMREVKKQTTGQKATLQEAEKLLETR